MGQHAPSEVLIGWTNNTRTPSPPRQIRTICVRPLLKLAIQHLLPLDGAIGQFSPASSSWHVSRERPEHNMMDVFHPRVPHDITFFPHGASCVDPNEDMSKHSAMT